MPEETRTSDGGGISHMTEVECRKEADGTKKRLHLGYSSEGFHAAVTAKAGGPFDWGKAYPEAKPALDAAWNTGPDSERMEGNKVAEIPEHLKAQADAVRTQTGAQQYPVRDMGETKGAEAYDTKALEAQRERQRQDAIQDKAAEPQPDKG
jgi:hypothetical protein